MFLILSSPLFRPWEHYLLLCYKKSGKGVRATNSGDKMKKKYIRLRFNHHLYWMMSVSTEWFCLSWGACTRSKGFHNGRPDLLQHTQMKTDHACNMKSVSRQPCLTLNQISPSAPSGWLIHQLIFHSGEQWYALIQKTWSDFLFFFYTAFAKSQGSLLTKCRVSILHAVTQYRHRFIRASMEDVSLFLLISLTLTLWRDIHERDGHSARTYYISEQLPLEACPVILGELLWRHVMSIGNEEGVAGY